MGQGKNVWELGGMWQTVASWSLEGKEVLNPVRKCTYTCLKNPDMTNEYYTCRYYTYSFWYQGPNQAFDRVLTISEHYPVIAQNKIMVVNHIDVQVKLL